MPSHSTVAAYFKGRPKPYKLFVAAKKKIGALGPSKMEVFATQISFGREKRKFAWVWLPQMWTKKRGEDCIAVTFKNAKSRIRDRRIAEAYSPKRGMWTHHVIIEKPSDIDRQVMTWLRAAYKDAA